MSHRISYLPGVTFGNGWPGNDGGCSSSGERSDAYPWSCGSPLNLLSFRSTHLPSCWRCLSSSQSGLCTIFISKSSSTVAFIMHGCEDDEFDSMLLPLLFLASCLRFGNVPTRSRSEFRWHLSSEDTPRPPYLLPESTSTVSALRFLLTESKLPWRVRTRSRSLCWYLKSAPGSLAVNLSPGKDPFARSRSPETRAISSRGSTGKLFPRTLKCGKFAVRAKDTSDSKLKLRVWHENMRDRSIDRDWSPKEHSPNSPNWRASVRVDPDSLAAKCACGIAYIQVKSDKFQEFIQNN